MDKTKLQEVYQLLLGLISITAGDIALLDREWIEIYELLEKLETALSNVGFSDDGGMSKARAMDIAHDYIAHDLEGADLGYVQDVVDELGITNDELYELGLECLMNVMA